MRIDRLQKSVLVFYLFCPVDIVCSITFQYHICVNKSANELPQDPPSLLPLFHPASGTSATACKSRPRNE